MNKILLLIQIANLTNLNKIFNIILQYNTKYNFICISILNTLEIDISQYNIKNLHIMYHDNKGMDIGPYLLQIKWMLSNFNDNYFDYIFKIHSKSNQKWFDELVEPIIVTEQQLTNNIYSSNKWLLNLDNLNKKHINEICETFNFNNIYYDEHDISTNIGTDIDVHFYSKYYDIPIIDCTTINSVMNTDITKEYISYHAKVNDYVTHEKYIIKKRRKNIKFVAGTIFLIKYNLVYKHFLSTNIDELYNKLETGCIKNDVSTYTHALERILSTFYM